MHAAPPVRMSLPRDGAWHVFVTFCVSIAAASTTAWVVLRWQQAADAVAMAAMSAAGIAGAIAWLHGRRRDGPRGVLAWDGAAWHWSGASSAPIAGEVCVMVDLGVWLLLRFSPAAPNRRSAWLPVSRSAAGPLWRSWRAAVYARRPAPDALSMPDRT